MTLQASRAFTICVEKPFVLRAGRSMLDGTHLQQVGATLLLLTPSDIPVVDGISGLCLWWRAVHVRLCVHVLLTPSG